MLSGNIESVFDALQRRPLYDGFKTALLGAALILGINTVRRTFSLATKELTRPAPSDHVMTIVMVTGLVVIRNIFDRLIYIIVFALNSRLLGLMIKRIRQVGGERSAHFLDATVIGLLVGRRARQNTIAYLSLALGFVIYVLICYRSGIEISLTVLSFFALMIGAIYANQRVLQYRIAHGLYGANEYEAREIIGFILSHSDKSNFTDSQGKKALLPRPIDEVEGEISDVLGAEGVGA